jgi:hypothetical protein
MKAPEGRGLGATSANTGFAAYCVRPNRLWRLRKARKRYMKLRFLMKGFLVKRCKSGKP